MKEVAKMWNTNVTTIQVVVGTNGLKKKRMNGSISKKTFRLHRKGSETTINFRKTLARVNQINNITRLQILHM